MKVIVNEKKIKRNAQIGTYLTIAGLVVMGGGVLLTFRQIDLMWVAYASLIVGFVLSQISFYFTNRFGRNPRLDQLITQSLKGLPGDYTMYHYNTPVSHLLVGPAGVWIIISYYQRGNITYNGKRWRQAGGGIGLAYMKIFGQESLGRPDLDAQTETENLKKFFIKNLEGETPPINVALVFTDKRAVLTVDDAPIPTLPAEKLKDFIRQYAKSNPFPAEDARQIKAILPQEEVPEMKKKKEEQEEEE